MCCDAPSLNWVRHLALSYLPSYCPVTLVSLCLLSQHCGFSVVFCGRVVSLWNRGDGYAGQKGVWCLLSTVYSLRVVLWVVEWRWVCGLIACLPLLSVFLLCLSCWWCSG